MPDAVKPVRRALISVSDKAGLIEAAQRLVALGVEIVSTGGTQAAIAAAGLPVTDVSALTGFPEILDGRVKTLHPAVHGGLLGDTAKPAHAQAMAAHGIAPFELVYVNLYPFEATLAAQRPYADCIENIDIGGPAMLRAAAKNHAHVAVCANAEDFALALAEIEAEGGTTLNLRRRLAARAYARTAAYDAAISDWLLGETGDPFPRHRAFGGARGIDLRYGENPHQHAAFYVTGAARPGVASARQLQGKPLSYNNIADADAAYELVAEFAPGEAAAVVIVKHANPCGAALGATLEEAYARALACDPVSAFGGIVASNRALDGPAARVITEIFTEVVIAPDADEEAIAVFAAKKNLRLLLARELPDPAARGLDVRSVAGGLLTQSRDFTRVRAADLRIVTKRAPTAQEVRDLLFAFTIAKHVKSNAIVYAKDLATAGVGAGQMNRKDSARIAALRAQEAAAIAGWPAPRTVGSACASDAYFPFADGLEHAIEAGATAVIQPGGSIRDEDVIAAADAAGIAMAFTGVRAFRH